MRRVLFVVLIASAVAHAQAADPQKGEQGAPMPGAGANGPGAGANEPDKQSPKIVVAVSNEEAKIALKEFKGALRTADSLEARQELVFSLHDVPHDLVLKELKRLIRNKAEGIRVVAALAVGGQGHNKKRAGKLLMDSFEREKKTVNVAISCIDGMKELHYYGYWPEIEGSTGNGARSAIVIRILELLGSNKDYRALPMLLKMYKVAMPKRVTWTTGTVNVDTGAAGDADNQAAKAAFNKKYGAGGSKAKAKAQGKARSFDARNFTTQIRACAKAVTGQDFETDFDLEDWWVDNWEMVARRIAQMDGVNVDKAVKKAMKQLPLRKKEMEAERRKLEEELEAAEKKNSKKR
jgi:hypothetical protein